MKKTLFSILRLLRPRQWLKNLAVFAAIVFTGQLFEAEIFQKVLLAFFVFCALSSSIYIVNDILDRKKDRMHPYKKYRPIAQGVIPVPFALSFAIVLGAGAFFAGFFVTLSFFLLLIIYALLQLSYSAFLKNIAVIDILTIASGYILRVYAGEFASGFHISVWLLLTTISISLFLAIGKRRSELTLVSNLVGSEIAATRKALSHYSERLLDVYASVFATSTFISYSLFTFLEKPIGFNIPLLMPEFFPVVFQKKWLMITIVPVVYGLMRYLQDVYEKHEGESPEKVLFSDRPLLITVVVWGILVITIIYLIGG